MIFLIVIHVIACTALIGLVLIQRGRGSGLVESFSGVESMLGTKTSAFLTRTTTVFSIIFFITCLGLAILSVRQSRSLMRLNTPAPESIKVIPSPEPAKEELTQQEAPKEGQQKEMPKTEESK